MVNVKYEDLSLAFDFVNFGGSVDNAAYISLDTGAIYWVSDDHPLDEEVPPDLETSDRYIAMPHKRDLDLGQNLALGFVAKELPSHYDEVRLFFGRRGAYSRFKELLAAENRLDDWYRFESDATERALTEWCAAHAIGVVLGAPQST